MRTSDPDRNADILVAASTFLSAIDDIYGVYLDATQGFLALAKRIEDAQARELAGGMTQAEADARAFYIGRGAPADPDNVIFHTTTQGAFKERNTPPDGRNHILMSQYLIVLVYTVWEVEHRKALAAALGLSDEKQLKLPLFGDLRRLRHDIVHRNGFASARTINQAEMIAGLIEDLPIALHADGIHDLIVAIRTAIDQLIIEQTGQDPAHRTVWRLK